MSSPKRALLAAAIIVGLFVFGYAASWYEAYRLSARYLAEAETSFAQGEYLKAFMGYEDRDPLTGWTIKHGGYYQVENIWRSAYAWPRPAFTAQASSRIWEIIAKHLTIKDAERFVQENAGKPQVYFAEVFLRLGELYEASGDKRSAIEIYREVSELFPYRPDIIARANEHLANLGVQP